MFAATPTTPCTVCTAFPSPETDALRSFRPRHYFWKPTNTHAIAFRDAMFRQYNHRGPRYPLAPSINTHYLDHAEIAAKQGDETYFAPHAPAPAPPAAAAAPAYEYEAALRTFLRESLRWFVVIAVLLLVFLGLGYLSGLLEYLVGLALVGLGSVVLIRFVGDCFGDWLDDEAEDRF
ncbi:hypothetical protein LZ554_003007 [Drepanopeziza brunnea f. sp. 'monogermtubi']|nr:hypothetical protein LZ554_003007 [Drepanopeziza brunnea f. sp. 'monogermtubi']